MSASPSVLIVDDDADLRDAFRHALESEGWDCTEAGDGAEALDRLHAGHRPDVILLDLMMPGMNGWEFREEQLRDPVLRGIPTVVVTASHRADPLPGTAAHVPKPVTLERLLHVLAEARTK